MSEMKHFLMYNGQNQNTNSDVQDQAAHELYFTPYEHGFVDGRAAATMCSYQIWRDTSTNPALADPIATLTWPSPYANPGENPQTWPLNESHFSCEQPLSLTPRAPRDVGLGGDGRHRLPGAALDLGDLRGHGAGDADDQRLHGRRQRHQRPDRQHVRVLHGQPGRVHAG